MTTTSQLADRYREQLEAKIRKFKTQNDTSTIPLRRAFWKMHRRLRANVYPRGKNFVLKFEGCI